MMLGIGPWEMIVIAAVALVVIGPERFPEFAKIVLRTFRDLRSYVDEVKEDVGKELKPVRKHLEDLSKHSPDEYLADVARAAGASIREVREAASPEQPPPENPSEQDDAGETPPDDAQGS